MYGAVLTHFWRMDIPLPSDPSSFARHRGAFETLEQCQKQFFITSDQGIKPGQKNSHFAGSLGRFLSHGLYKTADTHDAGMLFALPPHALSCAPPKRPSPTHVESGKTTAITQREDAGSGRTKDYLTMSDRFHV